MLQTLEEVVRLAPVPPRNVAGAGVDQAPDQLAAVSLPAPAPAPAPRGIGPVIAYFSCAAANNYPSGLNPRVVMDGHRADKSAWIDALNPATCDEVMYHLPFGGLMGSDMPFHGAILAKERGHKKVIESVGWLLEESAQKMGRLPWVYLGCMFSHWLWTNPWAVYGWQDGVWASTESLRGKDGRPRCKIAIDVAGVLDHRSLEWQAYLLLRRLGFGGGYEPRPAVGTPWANEADAWGWTTNALMRVTSEVGDGRGSGWAVPLSQVRGQQAVFDITANTSITERAGYLSRGLGLGVNGHTFPPGRKPDDLLRAIDLAHQQAAQAQPADQAVAA